MMMMAEAFSPASFVSVVPLITGCFVCVSGAAASSLPQLYIHTDN